MNVLREGERRFVDMPERIARLPRDRRGFPVPKFAHWAENGEPDFRVVTPGWMATCANQHRCWICGGALGRHLAFVIGPMCAVNRINSEPPSHYDCARFAARNCPFLSQPLAKRNERNLPEEHVPAAGMPIARNPGCACVWITDWYKPFRAGNGVLFRLGTPSRLEFWAHGRAATREEVEESVRTGLPLLEKVSIEDGPEAVAELRRHVARFRDLIDAVFAEEQLT